MAKDQTPQPNNPKAERAHRATYAKDKRNGGYNIRIVGPNATRFVGREVPVTTKDGREILRKLKDIIWAGTDNDTKKPVALYHAEPLPKSDQLIDF